MATNSHSPNIISPGGIFRPWQANGTNSTIENIISSSNDKSPTISEIYEDSRKIKLLPCSKSYIANNNNTISINSSHQNESSEVSTSVVANIPIVPKKKKITVIKKESIGSPHLKSSNLDVQLSSKEITSSTTGTSKSSLKRPFEGSQTSMPQRKHLKTETSQEFLRQEFPSFSGRVNSFVFPKISHPMQHFPAQFIPSSHNFPSPLVPLLEPPIFVPAAEVERVCARRPRPKRFTCGECGAAFSNRGQLSGHCRIHTGERPFRCTHPGCGKKFTRNEELTRHRRIHSGLRPFACGICPKRFGRKDHLKKHLRTHTRHVIPQIPPLSQYNHFHLQQLQQLHHLQQMHQFHLQMPILPFQPEQKCL